MKYLCDHHTHTSFCDGKHTPREMAERAYSLGFMSYGFSGHGAMPHAKVSQMTPEGEIEYVNEILALKEEYAGRMDILLGVEAELGGKVYTKGKDSPFDYIIGAVHALETERGFCLLDHHPDNIPYALENFFDGDFDALAECYYERVSRVPDGIDASFIAHLDLVSKYKDVHSLTFSERYYDMAFTAVERLIPYGIPFEINVGAITRGFRTTPYPDPRILRHIRALGGEIMVNGDTHSADYLGRYLDLGEELARSVGYDRKVILTKSGYDYKEL